MSSLWRAQCSFEIPDEYFALKTRPSIRKRERKREKNRNIKKIIILRTIRATILHESKKKKKERVSKVSCITRYSLSTFYSLLITNSRARNCLNCSNGRYLHFNCILLSFFLSFCLSFFLFVSLPVSSCHSTTFHIKRGTERREMHVYHAILATFVRFRTFNRNIITTRENRWASTRGTSSN